MKIQGASGANPAAAVATKPQAKSPSSAPPPPAAAKAPPPTPTVGNNVNIKA